MMKHTARTEIVKIRMSPSESKKLDSMVNKSCDKNRSAYIRNAIFSSKRNRPTKEDTEKLCKQKLILSNICCAVNQLKAGVDTDNALVKLESEAADLCRLLK